MKLFKKFLIISCFSFLFLIGNVKAVSSININYSLNSFTNYLSNHNGKNANDFFDMIINDYDLKNKFINHDNYIVWLINSASNSLIIYWWESDGDLMLYNTNSRAGISISRDNRTYQRICNQTILFNELGEYIGTGSNELQCNTSQPSSLTFNPTGSTIVATNYLDLVYNNSNSYPPGYSYDQSTASISINNSSSYNYNSTILVEQFKNINFDYDIKDILSAPDNPNKCLISNQIGTTRNISSLTFRVTGTTNALDYPLEGSFDIQSNAFFDSIDVLDYVTYFDVLVNDIQSDDEYDVDYNLQWIEGTSSDFLRLNYTITAIDDIDTNIDVTFTIKPKDSTIQPFFENLLLIYGCPPNNIYSNISFGYTDNDTGISYSSDSILSNWLQDSNLGNISPLINTDLIGDGPVDSILLLPLNIMRSLLNVFNTNTCQPLVLPLPYLNKNISLPCVNTLYSQINGLSTFLNWFSAIASAFILYEYFIRLFKWVDNLLTFRENNHFGGF